MEQVAQILKNVFLFPQFQNELFEDENFSKSDELKKLLDEIKITIPNSKINCHYCTNILFTLRRFLKPGFETHLRQMLMKNDIIANIEFINGYINFKMQPKFFAQTTAQILANDIFPKTGFDPTGKKRKVNVEYCSINPTGFLHIGHARNAIFGDSIARILDKANFDVTKEYYVNDAGNQINMLALSVQARCLEANNLPFKFPENGYVGHEIKDIAKLVKLDMKLPEIARIALDYLLNQIKKDLNDLKIFHDVFTYESDIINSNFIQKAIELLKSKDYIYYGIREDKKAIKGTLKNQELMLLKTTLFGDDEDRPLTKGDGEWTYLAPDIGYHLNKIERGFEYLICVLGADHDSYARRIKIAVKLLKEDIQHATPIVQMVSFEHDGKYVKFSKRAGNSIRTHDFIQEIHPDILRFMMLAKTPGTPFVFDYENACTISIKNPVFYIQYAYARGHSIFRNTTVELKLHENSYAFSIPEIQDLIITLSSFKSTLNDAAIQLAPHIIVNYAQRLAEDMHKLWQAGKIDATKRLIIDGNNAETQTRLAITRAFLNVLGTCLDLLGINAPETMN